MIYHTRVFKKQSENNVILIHVDIQNEKQNTTPFFF